MEAGLLLAGRTIKRRPLSLLDLPNDGSTAAARLPRPVVDPIALLEVAGIAVGADEVAQARAAGADRRAPRPLDRRPEPGAPFKRQLSRRHARMDAGEEQALVRIDVADADDAPTVHEEPLDAGAMRPGELMQALRMQLARERLDAEVNQQRMRVDVGAGPQHRAEAARIAQPQNPVTKLKVEVIVLLRRSAGGQHAQAPGHSQVQDQMAVAAVDEEVFAAALYRAHLAPREAVHVLRHRPAQARLAHRDARDDASCELRLESAPRDLDFGKLRHVENLLVRGTKYT